MTTPKFINNKSVFHQELKKRVNQYFEERNKPQTGNFSLYFKAIFLCATYFTLCIHVIFFTPPVLFAIVECLLLGILTAAIGFNVMHDGSHGSFSKNKHINKIAAISMNFLGASSIMWSIKHNIIHHTYTNVDGVDDDIEAQPWLRLCKSQKRYKMHRFQHYYFWFLYTLLHILWIFKTDYDKYFKSKVGEVSIRKLTLKEHLGFWAAKIGYIIGMIIVPICVVGFVKWLVGFLIITMSAGLILSIVFQLAHTVEHTHFPLPVADTNKIENEWAIHQLETTANFATKNKWISWYVGGLNFQIEHHLFPKISHVHYPAISKIIRQTCIDFGIQYIEFPRMVHAIASHTSHLRNLGRAD
ncbi:fatty acid desaturase family protein [Ferruginibacter albus]|uniref:fatty acid desaturase family protein n=1 Tax=Ferruginibacter albus TaxID=2875540 RepID=UPI001CC7281B|nr:acyl-CoA desaturase [Ferruginibacter albus]UAY53637.1 acyl-CoA desaturase [Ferruginibacter albus]